MKNGKPVLAVVLALLGLPPLVALVEAASFHLRNRNSGSIVSSGERREYLLHVPGSYDAARKAPLVISLHGGAGWPAQQRDLSGWNQLAERHGFIVVYPAGLDVGGMTGWQAIRPGADLAVDVRFISDLIDHLKEAYNIDPARIYANGFSNGGAMAFVLSCALPHRIAAIGMVAPAQTLPSSWCTEHSIAARRPVPMISFHGTVDPAVPYAGGTSWVSPMLFPDVLEWTAQSARRNGCDPDAVESAAATDVTRRSYTGCADGSDVELFTIDSGGHTWPGGLRLPEWFLGPTSPNVDATARMWAFFQEHPLPGRSPEREVLSQTSLGAGEQRTSAAR